MIRVNMEKVSDSADSDIETSPLDKIDSDHDKFISVD